MTLPSPAETTRILVVEDSATQAFQLRRTLERNGYMVECVPTAEAALEELNRHLPDLVIADYHLPGMNGDELSRQLRLKMRTRAIPIIMLTGELAPERERQGLESGVDAYVPKSADQELILPRIRALLRQQAKTGAVEINRENASAAFTPFRRARLLVVDDSPTFTAYLREILTLEGYEVTAVQTAEAAVAAIGASGEDCDAVVVNVLSPGFDGISLCARLDTVRRETASAVQSAQFQIVALGSDDKEGAAKNIFLRAFDAGVDDVLAKSTHRDILKARIRSLVRRKLLTDENQRISSEHRDRETALERARAEAAAAEAKATLAEALARANQDLEAANHKLRETQAQLVQSAKMASLGELVAGIAHEINNPLAFILAHQDTVERVLGEVTPDMPLADREARGAKARDRLRSMRLGLGRIQNLVLNLRKFSRFDEGEFQRINIPEALDTVVALASTKLGEDVKIERRLEAPEELFCAPALINQAVMNIVGNAIDALQGGGVIGIETRIAGNDYVIEVSDTGPGIPKDIRERIFEPFFTTKPVGAGTGLGLSIAYRIVDAHRGVIEIDDRPGGGTRFIVRVPYKTHE
ncbi:response regulator [Iodidimonas sp. SYSU 1G8]|uniref:response regulator n=1 Tax=Iodidimonas sp. SYSU 1G8 TaxID=3133967 RepID=UPI0031FEB4C4